MDSNKKIEDKGSQIGIDDKCICGALLIYDSAFAVLRHKGAVCERWLGYAEGGQLIPKIEVDGEKGTEVPVVVITKDNTLNFALNRIQSCLNAASEERLRELEHWEQLAAKWQSEGDHCGYNFHQGMAAGANYVDIFYHRIGREVDAIRAAQIISSTLHPNADTQKCCLGYDDR